MAGHTCLRGRLTLILMISVLASGSSCEPLQLPGAESGPEPESSSSSISHGAQLRTSDVGYTVSTGSLRASGPMTTSRDGQVIEGRDFYVEGRDNFALVISHDNVVVRNNRFRFPDGGQGIEVKSGTRGVTIEHNEFDAVRLSCDRSGHTSSNNNVGQRAMSYSGDHGVIRRNRIKFVRSVLALRGDHNLVVENYVDRLATQSESCADGSLHGTSVSQNGGQTGNQVLRNRVVAGASGAIQHYSHRGPVRGSTVDSNLIVGDGGGFGIYGGRTHTDRGHYRNNRDIKINNNLFTGRFRHPNVRGEGTNAAVDLDRPGNTFQNNRWLNNNPHGNELPARCGVSQDACH
jgi:hypothetical protein